MIKNSFLFSLFAALVILGGCSQEAQNKMDAAGDSAAKAADKAGEAVATDAEKAGAAVDQAAENAGEAVSGAAEDAAKAADNAGEAVAGAAENAGEALDAGAMSAKVKNAIITAEGIDTTDLNVDTVDKKITLKGHVPAEEQKKRAAEIAKNQAGGEYTVDNQLQVRK
jgi:osmotically-inducible protein OsmY